MEEEPDANSPYDRMIHDEKMNIINRLVNELPQGCNFFIAFTFNVPQLHDKPLFFGKFVDQPIDDVRPESEERGSKRGTHPRNGGRT